MESYDDLIAEALTRVKEIMSWDLSRLMANGNKPVLLDVREPAEFANLRITFREVYWSNPANGITTRLCLNWRVGESRRSWSSAVQACARCWLRTFLV